MQTRKLLITLMVLAGPGAWAGDIRPTFTDHVPMRDGIRLATDVYLPAPAARDLPAILIRTPYGRQRYNREYGTWKQWGYAVAVQDTRRRTAAGAEALAFLDDGWGENQDGADTVTWLTRQAFSNGTVGTTGASAMGITQYLLAPAAPDSLRCQYILVAAPSLYHHAAYPGGQLRKSMAEEWLRGNRFEQSLRVASAHPQYDDYWRRLDATRVAEKVRAAAIHYGGWFDCFLDGTIAGYVSRVKKAPAAVARNQKLLIGPWLHGGPSAVDIGDFRLPANARSAPPAYAPRRWFDCWLKGADNGARSIPAVTYYLMGPFEGSGPGNEWRTSSTWPPPTTPVRFHLQGNGSLQTEQLQEKPCVRTFVSNPRNPVPTIGGANLVLKERGPRDQRPIEGRSDVLVFSTDVLTRPLEVTGTVMAHLWIRCSAPDTTIAVRLTDVYPDGRSILICDGIRRAALRTTYERPEFLQPGTPALVPVNVGTTAVVFAAGHRMRIIVAGSNYPRFEVSGTTATTELLLSRLHASRLVVPVYGCP